MRRLGTNGQSVVYLLHGLRISCYHAYDFMKVVSKSRKLYFFSFNFGDECMRRKKVVNQRGLSKNFVTFKFFDKTSLEKIILKISPKKLSQIF